MEGVLHSACGVLGLNPGLATLGLGTTPAELSSSPAQSGWAGPRVRAPVKA